MKSNTPSVIDRIRNAKSQEEVNVLLAMLRSPNYRHASPATKRKAVRAARQRENYGFIPEDN